MKPVLHKIVITFVLLFLIAGARILIFGTNQFSLVNSDTPGYIAGVYSILEKGRYLDIGGEPQVHWAPFSSFIFAIFLLIIKNTLIWNLILTALLIYLYVSFLFEFYKPNEKDVFLFSAITFLFNPLFFIYCLIPLYSELPYMLFSISSIYFLFRAIKKNEFLSYILTGISLGFLFMTRYVGAFLILAIFAYLIYEAYKRKNARNFFITAAALFLTLSPLILRNYLEFGVPSPIVSDYDKAWEDYPPIIYSLGEFEIPYPITNFIMYIPIFLISFLPFWICSFSITKYPSNINNFTKTIKEFIYDIKKEPVYTIIMIYGIIYMLFFFIYSIVGGRFIFVFLPLFGILAFEFFKNSQYKKFIFIFSIFYFLFGITYFVSFSPRAPQMDTLFNHIEISEEETIATNTGWMYVHCKYFKEQKCDNIIYQNIKNTTCSPDVDRCIFLHEELIGSSASSELERFLRTLVNPYKIEKPEGCVVESRWMYCINEIKNT